MALSADTPRAYELGSINTLPVKASTLIYEGAAVGDDGAGYMRGCVAGDPFRGFAQSQADNSAVATDGAINVDVIAEGKVEVTLSGVAITDVGKPGYVSDDGTFTLTAGTNTKIGWVHRYVGTNTCVVAFSAEPEDTVTDSKAASVSTLASTADSKAVSNSVVISTNLSKGDSKAVSLSTLTSTADSKAVSNSGIMSANLSTGDSKAASLSTLLSTTDSKVASYHA